MSPSETNLELLRKVQDTIIHPGEDELAKIANDDVVRRASIAKRVKETEESGVAEAERGFRSTNAGLSKRAGEVTQKLETLRNSLAAAKGNLDRYLEQNIAVPTASASLTGLPENVPSGRSVDRTKSLDELFVTAESRLGDFVDFAGKSMGIRRFSPIPWLILSGAIVGVWTICGLSALFYLIPAYANLFTIGFPFGTPLLALIGLGVVLRSRARQPLARLLRVHAQSKIDAAHLTELFDTIHAKHQLETKSALEARDKTRKAVLDGSSERANAIRQEFEAAEHAHQAALQSLHDRLLASLQESAQAVHEFESGLKFAAASWGDPSWLHWRAPKESVEAIRLGTLQCESALLSQTWPDLPLPVHIPLVMSLRDDKSLMIEVDPETRAVAIGSVQSLCFRLLGSLPPGQARFTFIDPVGRGNNVASLMSLKDYDEALVTSRAWSESSHINDRLASLTEQMDEVIQHKLQDKYANVYEYNLHAPVLEPLRFVVVCDFPTNFTSDSVHRLLSIAQNGPRCGVHLIVVHERGKAMPYDFKLEDLERCALILDQDDKGGSFRVRNPDFGPWLLALESAPERSLTDPLKDSVGKLAKEGGKVEIPFYSLLQLAKINRIWKDSTADEIVVPMGPRTTTEPQEMIFGRGTAHHGLIAGRTGSGKSNLMHVIIMTLALKYSPEELQLYLIDFKQGVEFKCYAEAKLPQAFTIAIETEREFALSVMQRLERELNERGNRFRAIGATSVAEYRKKAGPLPRILLLVDEFQEFFRDDDMSHQITSILKQLVLQGRSYGIHLLMGTQSLANAQGLTRGISDQIGVRIALQCSDADSRLILASDNSAARNLSRPGEAIFNDKAGLTEGNRIFQVASISEADRIHFLDTIRKLADERGSAAKVPIIFEGNQLAHAEECEPLRQLLQRDDWPANVKHASLYLGEPIAIDLPVAASLRRRSGSNLLIVTRDESEGIGMCISSVLSISTQWEPAQSRIYLLDFTTADSGWAEHAEEIQATFPGRIQVKDLSREIPRFFEEIAKEVRDRGNQSQVTDSVYLVLQGMHRIRCLRENDEDENGINSVQLLGEILRYGPEVGVHVIAWADTWSNAARGMGRKTMGEFSIRVAGRMTAEESMEVLNTSAAAKLEKPYRVIFYDENSPGLTTFRPYAMPTTAWIKSVGTLLNERIARRQDPNKEPRHG